MLLTYRTRRVLVLDLEQVHGPDHGLHRHEDVLVDQLDVSPLLLVRKACSVDDLHLLDEGRFARLSSACRIKLTFKAIVVNNHILDNLSDKITYFKSWASVSGWR